MDRRAHRSIDILISDHRQATFEICHPWPPRNSDNGTAFTSSEFQEFLRSNGIEHLRSAPYHPSSNGLAERAVQTVKAGVKRLKGSLEVRLSRFLFKYRVTPQATTGIAPAELLMGRRLRTHLDLLFPTVQERVQGKQREQWGASSHEIVSAWGPSNESELCRRSQLGSRNCSRV